MTRKWTFMVYMAGDNGKVFEDGTQLMDNLVGCGWDNIRGMNRVGSTSEVAVVVQYDTLDANETPRLYVDQSSPVGQLVEKMPPINTGNPKNLTDFVVWAEKRYPAERYALVLWNHGTGWKEDDIYKRYREAEQASQRDYLVRAVRSRKRLLKHSFFLPTAAKIMSIENDEVRAICYDDTSMDFLDNRDLVNALSDAEAQTGQRLSVLGMDACLMSMIEVAYQIREHADYMVGSQEIEEGTGWPYDKILRKLVDSPKMSPLDLSKLIVTEFGEYHLGMYRNGGGINTQAVIDLQAIPQTFDKVKGLSKLVLETYSMNSKVRDSLRNAMIDAESFWDTDFVDLRNLMQRLGAEYHASNLANLADDLTNHLEPKARGGPIVENFHGSRHRNANGMSIYFPAKRYSPFYDGQAFVLSGWNKVIRCANGMKAPRLTAIAQPEGHQIARSVDSRQIICPICEGQTVVPTNIGEIGLTIATKGVRDLVTQIVTAIHLALTSPTTEANQWIDLPCPHCNHTFQYNIKTGETRR
jgi:hypothetical protein